MTVGWSSAACRCKRRTGKHPYENMAAAALLTLLLLLPAAANAWPTVPLYWHSGTADAPLDAELAAYLCDSDHASITAVTVAKFQFGTDEFMEEKIQTALATVAAACSSRPPVGNVLGGMIRGPPRLAYINSCMIFHDRYRLGSDVWVPTLPGVTIGDGRNMWSVFDWTEPAAHLRFEETLRVWKASGTVDGVFLDRGDCARALDIRAHATWAGVRDAWMAGHAAVVATAVDIFPGMVTTNNAAFPGAARSYERWPALQPIRFQELQTVAQSVAALAADVAAGRVVKATAKVSHATSTTRQCHVTDTPSPRHQHVNATSLTRQCHVTDTPSLRHRHSQCYVTDTSMPRHRHFNTASLTRQCHREGLPQHAARGARRVPRRGWGGQLLRVPGLPAARGHSGVRQPPEHEDDVL